VRQRCCSRASSRHVGICPAHCPSDEKEQRRDRSCSACGAEVTRTATPQTTFLEGGLTEVAGAGFEPSPLTLRASSYRIAETRELA
jgi:hypothetical protein